MSTLLQWFASDEWVQVVTALLHSLWQGAVIALLLALFLRRISNPGLRYRCSLAALVGVMLAGIITWAVLNASARNPLSASIHAPPAQSQASRSAAPLPSDNADKIIVTAQQLPSAPAFRWTGWLALIWLAGAVLMLIRMAVKVTGAGQLRRSCRPLNDDRIEKLLAEARHAVGLVRQVRVGVTDLLTSPAIVGVFVPMLVLPLSLLSTLTPDQIRFVLLHELAHIRRGDYLANLFQFFAESLLFFNPAVWWISHQMRREREACCDALATALSGAPADYARTLVHVAENVLQQTPAAASAFGGQRDSSSLLERIHRLLVPGYRPSLRLTWRAMLAGLTLGSALLILSAVGTRTTVAAILSSEKPAAVVPQATNQMTAPAPVQPVGASSDAKDPSQQLAETKRQLDEERDQLQLLAVKLGMPHDMADAAMQVDAPTLEKMFQSDSLRKYQPFADRKKELDALQRDQNMSEMKMLSAKTDSQTVSSEQNIRESQTIQMLEADLTGQLTAKTRAGAYFEAISERYRIAEPVDFSKITEKNFTNYAEFFKARLAFERYAAFDRMIINKIAALKSETSQPSTNLDFSSVTPAVAEAGKKDEPLQLQAFKIKPGIFSSNLRKQSGLFITNSVERETVALLKLFADAGVEIQPPKSLFLNPKGAVLVRATSNDLAAVAAIIGKLNYSLPQVVLKGRFIELPAALAQPFVRGISSGTNLVDVDGFSAILTSTQAKEFLAQCDSVPGANITVMPDVITASGRQAEVQRVDVMTLVKGLNPEALAPPGVTNQIMFYQLEQMYLGPTINLIPRVGADERTIQLSAVPKLTEFLGYDQPSNSVPVYLKGKKRVAATIPIPRPHFRTREMAVSVTMMDGQTLLLGGAPWVESVTSTNGIVETKTVPGPAHKQLFVLVTPVLVDAAGNRFHENLELNIPSANLKSP